MVPPKLILLVAIFAFWRLIKYDIKDRPGVSSAIWIPTLWVGIISSRPVSMWLGFGGSSDTLEGSPADRLFYFVVIIAAMFVHSRRRLAWAAIISRCWPVFLFYGFLLISVVWANSPLSSFKRWFKEFGNIVVLLVILTENDPQQAVRAVFARCGFILIPLSEIFLRWFPDIGRYYSQHSGAMEATGVTTQKNSLGAMVLACGLVILWDLFELRRARGSRTAREIKWGTFYRLAVLASGVHLLSICDSKTSIVCLGLSATLLMVAHIPFFKPRLRMLGRFSLILVIAFYAVNATFEIRDAVLSTLGRDATLTGRTDVWKELRNAGTDPLLGTGFMSFWDDMRYRSKLPEWVAFSAHNGYLEIYMGGGWVGICFLTIMIFGVGAQVNSSLAWGGDYSVFRLAVYFAALVANFTESNFAEMTPLGFLFLLVAIGYVSKASGYQTSSNRPNAIGVAGSVPSH